MAAEMRKMLEQLMGEQYVNGTGKKSTQMSITDSKVCRSYLVGTCPHDLFTNTKQDLGPCPKVHSEVLKTEYDGADDSDRRDWGFEFDYMRHLQEYVEECNRRIEVAQRRLEKTPDEIRQTSKLVSQISDMSESIDESMEELKIVCEQGLINKAVLEYYRIRQTKQAKDERERELRNLSDNSGPSGHQKLQVCDVCGAYLSRLDNDRRLADHFYGKMHLGYAQMRKMHEQLRKELRGRAPPPRQDDSSRRDGDLFDRDRDRDRGHGRRGNRRRNRW